MPDTAHEQPGRDAVAWARGRNTLRVASVPKGAVNLNLDGRRAVGPLQGFGRLWQTTYEVRLDGVSLSPAEVIEVWKREFARFWEQGRGSRFYAPERGLAAGDVVLINMPGPGGARISTGILVLYADETSFTFIMPEGHPFAGWTTFSAGVEDGVTVARAELLVRAGDPAYELAMPFGLRRAEDRTWRQVLASLAAHVGVDAPVTATVACLDRQRQWARAGNIRHNAALHSLVHAATARWRPQPQAPVTVGLGKATPGEGVSGVVLRDAAEPASATTVDESLRAATPRDAANWARNANVLRVPGVPDGAVNLNVEGRRVVGALQGFGQLWQRTYQIRLEGAAVTPQEVVRVWKEQFPEFLPAQSVFYPPLDGVAPGEVLIINLSISGLPVNTGVRVIYADDESFTVMTPEGHPESGWNTFSASQDDAGVTVAQIQSLARATDPIFELGYRLFGAGEQERTWRHVLTALASSFGVNGPVSVENVCIDPRVQWRRSVNIWHNAGIRTGVYTAATPLRWLRRRLRGRVTSDRRSEALAGRSSINRAGWGAGRCTGIHPGSQQVRINRSLRA